MHYPRFYNNVTYTIFTFSEKSSFVDSKADQNDDRDTLDFEFESDKVTMSSLPGNTAVANIGVGINGKLLKSIIEKRQGCVRYYLKCGANPNVTTSVSILKYFF